MKRILQGRTRRSNLNRNSYLPDTITDIDGGSAPPREMFNPDILLYLLEFVVSKRDLSSLMKTCKFLHRGGVSHMLKSTVRLKKFRSCQSFHLFMTSQLNTPDRFQFLHQLTLQVPFEEMFTPAGTLRYRFTPRSSPGTTQRHIELLVDVLHRASSLRQLEIGGNAELYLYTIPGLSAAVSSIPSLTRLSFPEGIGNTSGQIFGDMKSQPTSLSISIPRHQPRVDIIHLLTPVRNSLTKLEYRSQSLFGMSTPFFPPTSTVKFPNLRTLVLQSTGHVSLSTIVFIFPKLAHLTMVSKSRLSLAEMFITPPFGTAQRATLGQSSSSWARLESLRGTLGVLRSLGLQCPVGHIHIDSNISTSDVPHLQTLLKDLHPKSLHLTFSLSDYPKDSLPSTLIKILEESELTHFTLSLKVNLDKFCVFPNFAHILQDSSINLIYLDIRTICRGCKCRTGSPNTSSSDAVQSDPHHSTMTLHTHLHQMKQTEHTYKIASSSPSLRHIFLNIDLQKHPTYWEVEREESNHALFTMKGLCESIGEDISRKVHCVS